jgi:outer membrane protein, multidrug efflux system
LPIFEGGRNIANLGVSRAQYDEQVSRFRQQVLIAFQEVENALTDIKNYADQGSAIDRAVQASRRALALSEDQYSKGYNTFLDVLDAERTLLTNERTAAQILGSRQQAAVQLIKALGGRW